MGNVVSCNGFSCHLQMCQRERGGEIANSPANYEWSYSLCMVLESLLMVSALLAHNDWKKQKMQLVMGRQKVAFTYLCLFLVSLSLSCVNFVYILLSIKTLMCFFFVFFVQFQFCLSFVWFFFFLLSSSCFPFPICHNLCLFVSFLLPFLSSLNSFSSSLPRWWGGRRSLWRLCNQ